MKDILNPKFYIVASLILIAAISRLIPHPPNFTPIMSMALFGGALISNKKIAMLFPLLALFISDMIIGFHDGMIAVYFSFIAIALIGSKFLSKPNWKNVLGASLISAILFYLVTNFSSWLLWDFYPKTFSGLLLSYEAAIPFFRNSLLSTIMFSGVLFAAFKILEIKILVPQKIKK